MMGRSHAVSGWVTGVLTGHAIGLPPAGIIGFGCVTAGASALNDLDHDDSSASRVLGPVSRLLAETVQLYARTIYRITRGPGDPRTRGAHRGATHSVPLLIPPCALLAGLPWVLPGLWVAWIVGLVVGFCVLMVVDRLGSRVLAGLVILAAATGGTQLATTDPVWLAATFSPWVGLSLLVGTVTHVIGDEITEYGCYALAPLLRTNPGTPRERRWVRLALPKWVAFKTNGWFEHRVVLPLLVVSGVVVAPGVWPVLRAELDVLPVVAAAATAVVIVSMVARPVRRQKTGKRPKCSRTN